MVVALYIFVVETIKLNGKQSLVASFVRGQHLS